jgi:hypothetical protein
MNIQQESLTQEITTLKERNMRVETDKAWETSKTRVISLCVITYFIASLVMIAIGVKKPFLNALIPTLGFLLSTQSLPFIKKIWIGKYPSPH